MRDRPSVAWSLYARAARVWAVVGGLIFLPCAVLLLLMFSGGGGGLAGVGLTGLVIVFTYLGAYLFYTGGGMLLAGRRGWRLRLIFAPLATWNVLVVLSAIMVVTFVESLSSLTFAMPALMVFLTACAVMHVFVNGAFLIGVAFVRHPNEDAEVNKPASAPPASP
jgi:hypothetical protein